jgi:hypothetical protein
MVTGRGEGLSPLHPLWGPVAPACPRCAQHEAEEATNPRRRRRRPRRRRPRLPLPRRPPSGCGLGRRWSARTGTRLVWLAAIIVSEKVAGGRRRPAAAGQACAVAGLSARPELNWQRGVVVASEASGRHASEASGRHRVSSEAGWGRVSEPPVRTARPSRTRPGDQCACVRVCVRACAPAPAVALVPAPRPAPQPAAVAPNGSNRPRRERPPIDYRGAD